MVVETGSRELEPREDLPQVTRTVLDLLPEQQNDEGQEDVNQVGGEAPGLNQADAPGKAKNGAIDRTINQLLKGWLNMALKANRLGEVPRYGEVGLNSPSWPVNRLKDHAQGLRISGRRVLHFRRQTIQSAVPGFIHAMPATPRESQPQNQRQRQQSQKQCSHPWCRHRSPLDRQRCQHPAIPSDQLRADPLPQ